jgi:hypothetical protein
LDRTSGHRTSAPVRRGPRLPLGLIGRGATPLEHQLINRPDGERSDGPRTAPVIHRLEGAITARPLPSDAPDSQIRYFLDGTQRSFAHYIPGHFPIAYSVAAAAILQRNDLGNPSIVPGTLKLKHTWLIPAHAPKQPEIVTQIRNQFEAVVDPLERYEGDEAYDLALGDYNHFIELAYHAAQTAREELETEALAAWSDNPDRANDDDWIVVDGSLKVCAPRSIGLVKSFTRQHLTGADAITLYDLAQGDRTSAFQSTDKYASDLDLIGLGGDVKKRTLWYMRLHDVEELDARHGLVRIETDPRITTSDEIDKLSCWLLAEKRPRSNDARWANLLYPVHFLERILKQYVDREYGKAARMVR